MSLVCLLVLAWNPSAHATPEMNHILGKALVVCAKLGLTPEQVARIFGEPEGFTQGRIDWRENPDRYLLWEYTRYNVWVEWEENPFPRTGTGTLTKVHGHIE